MAQRSAVLTVEMAAWGEPTLLGKALAFLPFAPLVLPAVWSWVRVAQRLWQRRWQRPRWYARLLWTFPYTALLLVVWTATRRGLTPNSWESSCRDAGQSFDPDYAYRHPGPLPPLLNSAPCNRDYDLVAGWVNPTIVILLLMTIAASAALMASSLHDATEVVGSEPHGATHGHAAT
ncbi:MAG: hypothetical protein BGO26_06695 [Actinobacteria bacterium 69-20]|nr:MAG: hypothetical protein BGO26_06695 [Actinobacteria bacterium 69-20]